ncbi:MAG: acyl-CoA carboxylase subunit epsilon [Gordonia sp. (in: high G+C Gram-positive bacteria)]|uniref:acyl-CoA carboxylase subunit epsilon n=1 Tax=Gordonia sp. (in: high G+C Gram-positive bacteria) TaxID=84139 RepID=UPI0039E40F8D
MTEQSAPFLTVVKGSPSDEEIAALTIVLTAAASAGGGAPESGPTDLWGTATDMHRTDWGMPTSYVHRG